MRTVDQIVEDLNKARDAVAVAKAREEALVTELKEIYNKAEAALKLPGKPVFRSALGPLEGGILMNERI